jgi:hypothetical protein
MFEENKIFNPASALKLDIQGLAAYKKKKKCCKKYKHEKACKNCPKH